MAMSLGCGIIDGKLAPWDAEGRTRIDSLPKQNNCLGRLNSAISEWTYSVAGENILRITLPGLFENPFGPRNSFMEAESATRNNDAIGCSQSSAKYQPLRVEFKLGTTSLTLKSINLEHDLRGQRRTDKGVSMTSRRKIV